MKTVNAFLVYMILTPVSVACSQSNEPRFCVGAATEIHSAVLDEDREILMHLPASYDSTKDRYPVLYVLDGEWNFLHAISYITYLSDNNIAPEMIIVAIATTNRPRDFLPTHVPQVPESGGSDRFIAFLADELIPFVDRKYRTDTTRILYGESNSGLFGVYSLLTEPDLFEAYIVNSPTVRHDDHHINRLAKDVFEDPDFPGKSLIILYGGDEGEWLISPILEFAEVLKNHSPRDLRYRIRELSGERHAPPTALYEGIKLLYQEE